MTYCVSVFCKNVYIFQQFTLTTPLFFSFLKNPENISSNQHWAPVLYTVTIHHSLCKGQGLHFNTLGTSFWNVKDVLLSLCYWHHGWLNGRPLEPVWYRIRLAFSYLIKHARPFDIDISLVAPSGPQRVRQAFLVFNMIRCMPCEKSSCCILLTAQTFLVEDEASTDLPIIFYWSLHKGSLFCL